MRYLRWKLLYWLFRVRVSVEKVTKRAKLEREFRMKFQGDNADDERYDSW